MSKELENNFEPIAANIFPDCIDKVSSGISVFYSFETVTFQYISDLFAEATKEMITHVYMPRVIRQLVLYIQNRKQQQLLFLISSARVSKVAIECLLCIINTWKHDYLPLYESDIVKALTVWINRNISYSWLQTVIMLK